MQVAPRSEFLASYDKVVHVALYGVLGGALAWGKHYAGRALPHWAVILAGFAYGAVDEWHQRFVPRRHASLADLGADMVGVVVGYALLLLIAARFLSGPGSSAAGDASGSPSSPSTKSRERTETD